MGALWALCVLWALRTAVGAQCPEQCACAVGDELEYNCQVANDTITINARLLDYVSIDCEGASLFCSDFPSLSIGGDRPLPSLSIRDCSLPDPLLCIARRVGARDVTLLILRDVSTELQERHVSGLGVEKLMMFDAGAQKSIPVQALSALPTLHHFRLCGGQVELSGGEFNHAPPLEYLELGGDNVTTLPPAAFQGLGHLKTLNLWRNNISYVSEDAFIGLGSLQELYIGTSGVRSLPPTLLSHTAALHTVGFTMNNLHVLPTGMFHGLQALRQITISNYVPLTVQPHTFVNLPSLTTLKLDQASLITLPKDFLINCTSLVNFTLSHNSLEELPENGFEGLSSLERMDLSHNKIKKFSSHMFVGLKALKELKMDGNLIEELPEQAFTGLRHLQYLSLSHNNLIHIPSSSFQGCDSILHLSLTHNRLTLSPPTIHEYYNLEVYSPFNTLLRLQELDLRNNNVSMIFEDWRNVLLDLRTLDLSYNSFQEIYSADLNFLSSNIQVDLRHNNITTISLSRGHNTQQYDTSSVVLLDDNPLDCDCRVYEAAKRLKGFRPLTAEPLLDLNGTYCASPPKLKGQLFPKVSLDDLVCNIDCSNCECQIRPATDALDLDCYNDTVLPDPRYYELSHSVVRLRQMPADISLLPSYVTVLNLSGLGLKSVPKMVPISLEILDLTNNKLEEFPVKLLERNLSLKLSGNVFPCDCGTVQEVALMTKYSSKIIDWQSLKCKDGSYMWKLEVDKLCLVQRAALLGGVLATLGILLAASAVLMHRYSIEIRVFLTNRGLLCCFTDEYDSTKKYDVFVSFAHNDEVFVVDKLLPKLELDYRVCVHHRDWRVGDLIPAQIARSVEESRRTLIVLSRNFLESTWGMLEFRAAHVQAAREKKVRVIVLLLEDINDIDIDRELRAYLTTNTYVKWGDPWFWEKLQFALPKKTRARDVREEKRTKFAADMMVKGGLQVTLTADGKLVNNAMNKHAI